MPVYRTRGILELVRGVKCFLNFEVGLTRGQVPQGNAQANQQVRRLQQQLKSTREELSKVKKQLPHSAQKERRAAQPGRTRKEEDGVLYDGVLLPPVSMRNTRRGRMGDEVYFEATRREVEWMVENLGLSRTSSLLDLGCGAGRIAIGILDRVGEIRKYRGVDANRWFLNWGWHHITPEHPNFQFIHVDAKNDYYNPGGESMGENFSIPFAESEFDIVCLFSVFTHMLTEDVKTYLKEFYRVLRLGGKILMTANLEDGVPEVSNNPVGYRGRQEYKKSLATVRYNREFFENLLEENGFHVERYAPELRETQRCLIVSKKAPQDAPLEVDAERDFASMPKNP